MDDNSAQFGSGNLKRRASDVDDESFISKVANLVSQRLNPNQNPLASARPVNTGWTNYDLSPPSTSVIGNVNTTPPVHYNQPRLKNDENDSFGL